jgi:hypothetical protein
VNISIGWRYYANDTNDNWNVSQIYTLTTTDGIAPFINVSVPSIEPFNNTTIEANVTDNVAVDSVIAFVTFPNTTVMNYTLINVTATTWRYNLTNLTDIGDYDVTIYANDTINNTNNTTTWFEVYIPVWYNGTSLDAANNPIDLSYYLYKVDTARLLDNFSTNASGDYEKILHKRYYDFDLRTLNNTLNFSNVSITSDIVNATLIDNIPTTVVGLANSRVSKAMYFTTILNYSSVDVIFNYTGTSYTSEISLGVYRCDNWVYSSRVPAVSNACWTRISSSLDTFAQTLTVTSSDLSGAYAVAEFICGDGVCEENYGESSAFCIADCPSQPYSPGGGGGGGGPPPKEEEELEITTPIILTTKLIEVRLYPGEYQLVSIGITNNKKEEAEVKLSVQGDLFPYTLFEDEILSIAAKQTEYTKIKFFTMPTTIPGIYNGRILVKEGNTTQIIDVILRVEYEREKLLDLKIDVLTEEVAAGRDLKYRVTIYNLGLTKKVDVFLNYTIKSADNDELITISEETVAVETSTAFVRTIKIPEMTEEGLYILEAIGYYDEKLASSIASFRVIRVPWIIVLLMSILTNWLTYVILGIMLPSFYLGWKTFDKWKERVKRKRKYARPLDAKKLPDKGLWVGKIAETKIKAYIDDSKLTTHTIIAGGTGSGKTVAAMTMAEEALNKGIPVIVFDPTAQWTGFIRPNRDEDMLKRYKDFGMKREQSKSFKGNIMQVKDPFLEVKIENYIKKGEISIFTLNKLTPDQLDYFIRKTIDYMFKMSWPESRKLKLMLIYDEVHRLLPQFSKRTGASLEGGGYQAVERACREFRKWGIGLVMISQVLQDFKGAIRAVIATEIQMRTKYEGDVKRVQTKYGWEFSSSIPKLEIGTGMIQNAEFNEGKPWFIKFRPLLHSPFRLTDDEMGKYDEFMEEIENVTKEIEKMKKKKIDTYDIELELKLAKEKLSTGQMRMAETYIESVRARMKKSEKEK